jgi:transposase-like protein
MARKANLELRDIWRARLKRQRESGLTVAEFCRREGVSSATLFAWKRKLQDESPAASGQMSGRRPTRTTTVATRPPALAGPHPAFVQLPLSPTRSSPWIELVLVEGTIIRLPQQNLTALETILRTLRGDSRSLSPEETRHA